MLELSALAVALQGVGYASMLVAMQGLWAATVLPPPLAVSVPAPQVAVPTRRRVRRYLPYIQAPTPLQAIQPAAEQDDDELLLLGAL